MLFLVQYGADDKERHQLLRRRRDIPGVSAMASGSHTQDLGAICILRDLKPTQWLNPKWMHDSTLSWTY